MLSLARLQQGSHHGGWALSVMVNRLDVVVGEALGLDVGVYGIDAVKPALLVPVADEDRRGVLGQGEVRAQAVAVDIARPYMHLHNLAISASSLCTLATPTAHSRFGPVHV